MKICYIASLGSTGHTERWIKYFADTGHEVHLIVSDSRPPGSNIGGVKLHLLKRFGPRARLANYLINSAPLMLQFKRLIRNIDPDIIHAQSITDITLLGAASGFHAFVVTPWGSDVLIAPQKSRVSRWIVKYVLKRADLITCDAEHIQEALIWFGADPQKIKLVYFGVDTQEFKPGPSDEKLRKELQFFNSPTIITSRRLDSDCDIVSLLAAIPLVLAEVPETKFMIIGRGTEEAKLKELAESLGVSESVKFLGWVPHSELSRYITSADIYASTALSDAGLAASTAEAMACGLPVVITDFGDNKKWVEDGVNGFTIPLKSPETLASKLIYLLKHEDVRRKFGQLNCQIIEERNNWEKEMGKMAKLYEGLIEKCKR